MRRDAIQKIAGQRDYWVATADAAYRRGDARAYAEANEELGRMLQPFERLTGRRWEWRAGGINDGAWR
jgi:hypothetical protein